MYISQRSATLVRNYQAGELTVYQLRAMRDLADDQGDEIELGHVKDAITELARLHRLGMLATGE